jgi:DNA/RNA endonuclease YhcR with UshA esterase domain
MKKTLLFKSIALSLFMLFSIGILNAQVIITQYYEGAGNDKYVEITNIGTTSVDLSTYYIARWSGTDSPADADSYANGGVLSGSIASGETQIYMNSSAANPAYAVSASAGTTTATYFNGDDPVALLEGGETWGDRVDCIYGSISDGKWGDERSFVRKTGTTVGNTGMSVLDGTGEWTEVTLEVVADAGTTDGEYLGYYDSGITPATGFDVTFNVDMNNVTSFVAGTDVVYIAGDIASDWAEPGSNAAYEMTDSDSDGIYTITLTKDPAGDIAYKFYINAGWGGGEWDGDPNRSASISEETTLDAVFGYYIYDIEQATAPFYAGDEVTITWSAKGSSDVKVEVWIPENAAWDVLFATTTNDGTEPFTIPADAWHSDEYRLRVSDATIATAFGLGEEFEIIAMPTIFEVQSNTSDGDLSNYDGQKVVISGVVTAVAGSNFWIQMAPAGKDSQYPEWSGIFGYDGTVAGAVVIGDDVTMEATIDEYYNATEIVNVTSHTINSQGNTISPVAVTADAALESYESTLITIMGAEVTSDPDSNGEFTVNDGTADYIVDDKIFEYSPTIGEVLDITGVTTFSYGAFKLLPRSADDVTVASGVGFDDLSSTAMSVYPNPSNGKFYLQMGDAFEANAKIEVFNVVGMKVFETISNDFKTEIDLSDMKQGVYYVRVDDGANILTQKVMKQ